MPRPTIDDIQRAAERLRGVVLRTPTVRSPWLSELTGGDVWLKLELLQHTGSFKLRGAFNALSVMREALDESESPTLKSRRSARTATAPRTMTAIPTVTTASAGNHGLALATAAARLEFRARVHLPKTAPAAKRDALRRLGAEIVEADTYDDAEKAAQEDVARGGVEFVSAYSHSDVIAGAGTVALEVLEDSPPLDVLIVPVGGGGLISGIAIAARAIAPSTEIRGAEAAASPVFTAALAAGRPVTVEVDHTLADGLAGNMEPDSQTFPIVRDLVASVDVVPEATIAHAMRELIGRERLIVEGASAVALGLLLANPRRFAGRRIGVVLTGRNVDPRTIQQVLAG